MHKDCRGRLRWFLRKGPIEPPSSTAGAGFSRQGSLLLPLLYPLAWTVISACRRPVGNGIRTQQLRHLTHCVEGSQQRSADIAALDLLRDRSSARRQIGDDMAQLWAKFSLVRRINVLSAGSKGWQAQEIANAARMVDLLLKDRDLALGVT